MSFIIDSDICSAYLRGDGRVQGRFLQYSGGLYASAVTLAELYTWVYKVPQPSRRMEVMLTMLGEVQVVPVDEIIAEKFGQVRAGMLGRGTVVATSDLLIAVTALHLDYTVVTHNTKHFSMVPGLRLQDWLSP